MKFWPWVYCLAAGLTLPAGATQSERARLASERTAVGARLTQDEHRCQSSFAVTSCLTDARARHRAELARLRERDLVLDESLRTERAAERRAQAAAKQQAAAARAAALPASATEGASWRGPAKPAVSAASAAKPKRQRVTDPAAAAAPVRGEQPELSDARRARESRESQQAREARAAERERLALQRQAKAEQAQARVQGRKGQEPAAGSGRKPLPTLPPP